MTIPYRHPSEAQAPPTAWDLLIQAIQAVDVAMAQSQGGRFNEITPADRQWLATMLSAAGTSITRQRRALLRVGGTKAWQGLLACDPQARAAFRPVVREQVEDREKVRAWWMSTMTFCLCWALGFPILCTFSPGFEHTLPQDAFRLFVALSVGLLAVTGLLALCVLTVGVQKWRIQRMEPPVDKESSWGVFPFHG